MRASLEFCLRVSGAVSGRLLARTPLVVPGEPKFHLPKVAIHPVDLNFSEEPAVAVNFGVGQVRTTSKRTI